MPKGVFVNIVGCILTMFLSLFCWTQLTAEEEGPEVYQQEVQQMTTLECARCHYAVFADIRDTGGAHQIPCRECHETFHTYRPGKNWKDVVPDCTTCHDEQHGEDFPDCLRCHENAHAPSHSLNVKKMAEDCTACHTDQATEAKQHPSGHTETPCVKCHYDSHGFIATCTECHKEPHTPFVDDATCIACHPPHSPLEVSYSANTANSICAGCHDDVSAKLLSSDKGHALLQCVFCHADKHRFVPTCQHCHHTGPHSKEMVGQFKGCQDCHGDAHALILQEGQKPVPGAAGNVQTASPS